MITNTPIGNTNTALVSVPAGKQYAVTQMIFSNVGASDEIVDLFIVPNGGTATNLTKVWSGFTIPAGNTYVENEFSPILNELDTIVAKGTTGALVNFTPIFIEI
jgi:hypothetical protein